METVRQIAERYWRAEESRGMEAILNCYHPDAELVVPEMGRLVGHAEIRRFYEPSIKRFRSLKVEIKRGVEQAEEGVFEWEATFTDNEGKVVVSQGANIVVINDGKFQSVHVYYGAK